MLTSPLSTAVHQADADDYSDDLDERSAQQYLVRIADRAVWLAMEHISGSEATNVRNHGVCRSTMSTDYRIEQDIDFLSPIVTVANRRLSRASRVTFHALQEWEGYVTEISDLEFTARLTDLTSGAKYAGEEASIPLDEISDDDAEKTQVGSIFRWVIGYERKGRAKKRVSQIVFRDLPVITKSDLRDGREWGHSIVAVFQQ